MITLGDLGSLVRFFLGAAEEFIGHIADVAPLPFAGALLLLLAMQLVRARAWLNVLRAAYPRTPIAYRPIAAAFLVGVGVNAILPARAGDAAKIVLAKQAIPRSSYPAVTSSFAVQTVFDTTAGVLVLIYAVTQGILPTPPQMPRFPALDYTFWTTNPQFAIPVLTLVIALTVLAVALAARHVRSFWARVRQGAIILASPGRYLREVAAWQGAGWLCRFAAFWLFLEAFGIGGSVGNVMLVMSVQAIANLIPLTPGGAGAQQALLVATLEGPSRIAVLSFSVGLQLAMAAWGALIGFLTLLFVFGISDWRDFLRGAEHEIDRARAGGTEPGGSEELQGTRPG